MVGLVMTQVARTSRTTAGVLGLSRRGIAGQAMRDRHEPKPAAFDYERKGFNLFRGLWDKTTSRMDENSKLIMVDGAHGVAQSELCRALAEEFEMLYLPQIRMDDFYINPYGQDYRKLDDLLLPRTRSYDEKDFIRDPLAVPGCYDRQHFKKFEMMVEQSMAAYRHIFNTGQGVIMERGPFSDLIYARAALNAGWLSPSTLDYLRQVRTMWIGHLLRPNLLIWLDSPVSEVQKKMKESGNEWDVNSPVWKNTRYLQDIYEGMKNNYLKEAKSHSQVLVYDWTNPGDTEIVVEDIEDLNFDHYGLHDEQQSDWRWYNETEATALRLKTFGYWRDLQQSLEYFCHSSIHPSVHQNWHWNTIHGSSTRMATTAPERPKPRGTRTWPQLREHSFSRLRQQVVISLDKLSHNKFSFPRMNFPE